MALYSTKNMKDFDECGVVKRNVKLGDRIYTGEGNADFIAIILSKNKFFYTQKTIDVAGKNVHEFTIKLKPLLQLVPKEDLLLAAHYEADLAC